MQSLLRFIVVFTSGLVPAIVAAGAQTGAVDGNFISQAVGFFNVFVGLMLTAAMLTYGIGLVVWWVRLGTWPTYRTEAIKIMEWSVVILFVLVILLAIVQFFQNHPRAAGYTVSVLVLALVVWAIIVMAAKGGKKDEHA